MDLDSLKQISQDVLKLAKNAGASSAECDVSFGTGQSVSVRLGETENIAIFSVSPKRTETLCPVPKLTSHSALLAPAFLASFSTSWLICFKLSKSIRFDIKG